MMRTVLSLFAAVASLCVLGGGLPSGWTDDFAAAKEKAAAEGKNILMVFSGSDWCGWCVKFDRETLSKPDFVKSASKRFVLVLVDSPRDKSKLSTTARTQNPKLVSRCDVHGYPHYVVTDADGKEIARGAGCVKGGARANHATTRAAASAVVADRAPADSTKATARESGEVYRVNLVGIAVVPDSERWNPNAVFLPPQTHVNVPGGSVALFKIEYDFPGGFSDSIWARPPKGTASRIAYFAKNSAKKYQGKGVTTGFFGCFGDCELKSISICGSMGEAVFPVDIAFGGCSRCRSR